MIGVAISTTGDKHRMRFLETSVVHWLRLLPADSRVFVTVDGDEEAVARVVRALWTVVGGLEHKSSLAVYRVGQRLDGMSDEGRLGVAVNKNTGLELLMDAGRDEMFLCDDDTWPLSMEALRLHVNLGPHSMVCWGGHRWNGKQWTWPRGSLLYVEEHVVEKVGGLVEAFGPGGHEHVEWSRRIHQHGFGTSEFPAPRAYSEMRGMGARRYWHAEDMPRPGEPLGNTRRRKMGLTSVRRKDGDWEKIEKIMAEQDGNTAFVPFRATENGRTSATLCWSLDGYGGEK